MAFIIVSVIKAILTRLLFAVHSLITIWRVTQVYNDPKYWMSLLALVLLLFEATFTLVKRKGREWKWFCPSFFLYLVCVVPGICFLELDRLDRYREIHSQLLDRTQKPSWIHPNITNTTTNDIQVLNTSYESEAVGRYAEPDTYRVYSTETYQSNTVPTGGHPSDDHSMNDNDTASTTNRTIRKSIFEQVDLGFKAIIPITLTDDMWVTTIEQTMLLLLIIGRWLLPKGDITRDQLSQLLFVYIGMSSDIMELYVLFQEDEIIYDILLTYIILAVWSVSLLQFCLVLTATKARKPRVAGTISNDSTQSTSAGCCHDCCASEIWSILIMVFLQDAPFLTIRLYVTITYKLLTYNILFFTAKNSLVILLQLYRLTVVCSEINKRRLRRRSTRREARRKNQQSTSTNPHSSTKHHIQVETDTRGQKPTINIQRVRGRREMNNVH